MTKLSKASPVKDLIAAYNELSDEPITSWKTGKDKLLARISTLQKAKAAPTVDYSDAVLAAGAGPLDSIATASEKLLEQVAFEHDGRRWGIPYAVILDEVHRVFPDCNTSVACLRWYAARMTDHDVKLPNRKRSR